MNITADDSDLAYAVKLVHAVCCLSGSPNYADELRERGVVRAIKEHFFAASSFWLQFLALRTEAMAVPKDQLISEADSGRSRKNEDL